LPQRFRAFLLEKERSRGKVEGVERLGWMAFPVKSAQAHSAICGVPTDFHVSVYADRVLVIITQNGKPGTLLLAQRERGAGGMGTGKGSFTTKVLMGKRDDFMHVYARRVAEMVAARSEKPLLLTLCVKDDSPEVFKAVMATLDTVAIW
jgi:hypothetical protein